MEARTEAHLATAERNYQFARVLLDPAASALLEPPPLEWAVTMHGESHALEQRELQVTADEERAREVM